MIKEAISTREMVAILGLVLLGSCTAFSLPDDLATANQITIVSDPPSKMRSVSVITHKSHFDLWGLVLRGNNSHVPQFYQGHIDMEVVGADGNTILSSVIKLRSRQTSYRYHFPDGLPGENKVLLSYSKWAHGGKSERKTRE